jgi:hypothetical protein
MYWLTTYETPEEADYPIDCMAERCARAFRSQGCAKRTAFGGDRYAVVLEFEKLWRIMATMQSTGGWRRARRPSHICLNQDIEGIGIQDTQARAL